MAIFVTANAAFGKQSATPAEARCGYQPFTTAKLSTRGVWITTAVQEPKSRDVRWKPLELRYSE